MSAGQQKVVTLDDVLKVIADQGRAIGELTNAVRNFTVQGKKKNK